MKYDYEEEVRAQLTANIFKLAVPIITPLYLVLNVIDWMLIPSRALEFFWIRFSMIPLLGFFCLALKKKWPGSWHLWAVWVCAFAGSMQLTYMASRSGNLSSSLYLHSVNLEAGSLLFIFPMRGKKNWGTLLAVYFSPMLLFLSRLFGGPPDTPFVSMVILCLGMIVFFALIAARVDRLRYQACQQKVHLYFLATTDVLSGLKLRRYFFNRFIQELSLRFRTRKDIVLSVAIMDLDGFKSLNDRYGHEVGDRCIKQAADIIRSQIRVYDVACRFGGEEFIILFPETPLKEAEGICEKIRRHIQEAPIRAVRQEIPFTVSVGVSGSRTEIPDSVKAVPAQNDPRLFLVKHMIAVVKGADDALYEAKAKGKNRVVAGREEAFVAEIGKEEGTSLQDYLVYFEQPLLILEPGETGETDVKIQDGFNFYPQEFFFRRCVEGLYRWRRNSEWTEVLAVIRIRHPDPSAVTRQLHKIFRLADAVSIFDSGVYGIIFFWDVARGAASSRESNQNAAFTGCRGGGHSCQPRGGAAAI